MASYRVMSGEAYNVEAESAEEALEKYYAVVCGTINPDYRAHWETDVEEIETDTWVSEA